MNDQARPIRILFASDTSGHTAGYHVVARGLRDAGFEVILAGRQLPAESASAALQEGADLVAIPGFKLCSRVLWGNVIVALLLVAAPVSSAVRR